MRPVGAAADFARRPLAEVLAELGCADTGLGEAEAGERLRRTGPNTLQVAPRHLLLEFAARFRNPLVIVLLVASVVSAAIGEGTHVLIIGVIVFASVTLDFLQEVRAGRAAEKLRQSVAVRATVCRDGRREELPLAALVPGDVVLLAAGDIVPADGRLLEARDFFVNQAMLTGEPYPVEKHAGDPVATEGDGDPVHAVFMGTAVISGFARMLVCRTGAGTAIGEIAGSLARRPPPTAFETGARRFGLLIMRLTVLLVLFVVLVNGWFHRPLLESFLFAVALAVGLTPELLPMVVTVTLSRGALRMAERQVVVKRLAAIHDLGAMDVLCTDKTGTLTEARIRLERHVDSRGEDSAHVLRLVYLNSAFETGLRSPLDDAVLEHREVDITGWRKVDEVPFDFERRRVSVLVDDGEERLLVVKGAAEDVLRLATRRGDDVHGATGELGAEDRARILALHEGLAGEGFRSLGVAWRRVPREQVHAVAGDEADLVFAGLAAFLDPPKASAGPALRALADSGITVKVVTGDHELVTRHVCASLGLPVTGVLTGAEIQQLDDAALRVRAADANLFCRVTPPQKDRVILALKARGHTVGYLGDGVNDAPALRSADVGISVDGAVDVAREAASLILLQQDLGVLREGVVEGRRTFANIMKYIMMATSSNFGNMFSMAAATLFLPFLPMLPVQVLLNNLLYDVSEIPIPLDRVDPEHLREPRRWDMGFIRNFMLVLGPVSSVFDFLTFWLLLKVLHADEVLFHTGWFIESMATQVLVIFVIRTRGPPWASRPAVALALTSVAVVVVAALLPLTPAGPVLGFVEPPPVFFGLLAAMVVAYLLVVEAVKRAFYARLAPVRARPQNPGP